ncbi:hypothetical protein ERJ75_000492600 [Trypanosoma vivax]|nr:hypothetical protein ERJ75_000492600 [Trypanosoma vivax]
MAGDQDGACTPTSRGAVRTVSDILCAAKAALEQAGKDIEGAEGEAAKAVFGQNATWSDMSDETRQQALLKDLISPAGATRMWALARTKKAAKHWPRTCSGSATRQTGQEVVTSAANQEMETTAAASALQSTSSPRGTWTLMKESAGLDVSGDTEKRPTTTGK